MDPVKLIYVFMAAFGTFCGVGVLLARVDDQQTRRLRRLFPLVVLFRWRWGRWSVAAGCFFVSALSLAVYLGWLR